VKTSERKTMSESEVNEREVNERESFTHCYTTRTDSLSREVSNKNQRDNKLQQNVVKSNIFHLRRSSSFDSFREFGKLPAATIISSVVGYLITAHQTKFL
jgi:type IV secretory pathway protease TraF